MLIFSCYSQNFRIGLIFFSWYLNMGAILNHFQLFIQSSLYIINFKFFAFFKSIKFYISPIMAFHQHDQMAFSQGSDSPEFRLDTFLLTHKFTCHLSLSQVPTLPLHPELHHLILSISPGPADPSCYNLPSARFLPTPHPRVKLWLALQGFPYLFLIFTYSLPVPQHKLHILSKLV